MNGNDTNMISEARLGLEYVVPSLFFIFFNHLYCLPVLQVLQSVQRSSHTLQQTHPVNVLEISDHHVTMWLHHAKILSSARTSTSSSILLAESAKAPAKRMTKPQRKNAHHAHSIRHRQRRIDPVASASFKQAASLPVPGMQRRLPLSKFRSPTQRKNKL